MTCYRCLSIIPLKNNKICMFCIRFGPINKDKPHYTLRKNHYYRMRLLFKLSFEQQAISKQLLLSDKKILVHAVCGSGKTEILLNVMSQFLKKN